MPTSIRRLNPVPTVTFGTVNAVEPGLAENAVTVFSATTPAMAWLRFSVDDVVISAEATGSVLSKACAGSER